MSIEMHVGDLRLADQLCGKELYVLRAGMKDGCFKATKTETALCFYTACD